MSQKSSLAALKELSRRKIVSAADYVRAMAGFDTADDRSFAIVQGSMVELACKTAILRSMQKLSRDDENILFAGFGPLATFSSKIIIAYSFGVFGKKARADLEKIKDIRNAFAHTAEELSFEQE